MRNRIAILTLGLLAVNAAAIGGENIDPAGDGHQYAWAENVGWINAEPNDDGGNGVEVRDFTLLGWMWGENIGWISLACDNTQVCGVTQYGVANDGSGHLSGFAWSENAGWINFAPTTCLGDPTCGVTIDPATGYFSGRAWSENDGWITFSSGPPETWTARTSWCQGVAAAPGFLTGFKVSRPAGSQVATLSWDASSGATWYDVVAGPLSVLRSSGGDYSQATTKCVANRIAVTTTDDPTAVPPPGNGVWFVARASNCRGRGTYDGGSPSQHGGRDAGIAASRAACP
ncbi:MAG TPA: hypothetical protein VFV19_16565 [Candidatus Polarisedimenticolaceae bacterium]|nr:hypothetical protein [Candidatus Polarisedimenticolaceae bacterium]